MSQSPSPSAYRSWQARTGLFLFGQTVSLFGSSLVQYAIVWYITLTTSSGLMMTISTLCGFLPQIAISLFAGVWADRFNRKILIMLSDSLIAASTLMLALLFLAGYQQLWLLFLISAIRSAGAGVQTPSVNALIPQLVPPDKLMRVNGINGSMQSLTMIVSPAVAGWILSVVGMNLSPVLFIDLATAVVGVGLLGLLRVPRLPRAETAAGPLQDLRNGVSYVLGHRFLRMLLVVYAVLMFLITPAAMLTPLMIERTYGDEVWRLTWNEVLFSLGSVIGGILIAAWGGFRNRIHTIVLAGAVFGVMTVLMGVLPGFVVYLVLVFLTGISMPFFNSPSIVLLQEKVEPEMQGRVFSFVQIVGSAALPLGMVVFGPLADLVGRVQILLIVTGIGILILSGLILRCRTLVAEGRPSGNSSPDPGMSMPEEASQPED